MNKQDKEIISILSENNITDIRRLICNTNKGVLELMVRKGENRYFLTLDSVPLEKEVNDKLMDLLYKKEIPTVNKTLVNPTDNKTWITTNVPSLPHEPVITTPKKKVAKKVK